MPLLWLSLSFLTGLLLGASASWPGWPLLALTLFITWLTLRLLPNRFPLHHLSAPAPHLKISLFLICAALFAGAWRYDSARPHISPNDIAALNGQGAFRITAVVIEPPDLRDQNTLLRLRVEQSASLEDEKPAADPQPTNGLLLVLLPGRAQYQYGDRLQLDGKPVEPPGADENDDFSYRDYLARQGVYSYMVYPRARLVEHGAGNPLLTAIYTLRDSAYAELYRLFPAPEAPLLAGILLGIESDLPPALKEAFRDTGTAHIIAISGFNIAILAASFSGLFERLCGRYLSRWWPPILAALSIIAYTILVGASPSVVRAAIMGSLALLAGLLGRRSTGLSGLNTLAFTAAVMCLFTPTLLWDASFQLSFGATLGLMLYASPLQEGFTNLAARMLPLPLARRLAGPVGEYFLFTIAAQLVTLPIILYHFQRLSLTSLLANPLVLPAQPPLMILSGLAVLVGLVFEPLARPLAWLALPLSAYTIRIVESFATVSGGVISPQKITATQAIFVTTLVVAPPLMNELTNRLAQNSKSWLKSLPILLITGLAAAALIRLLLTVPDGKLHLTLFNQDGTPVLFIQSPSGSTVLVNGGPSANRLSDALGRRLSPFDQRIDVLLLTDCRSNSLESLPALLERFSVPSVWMGCELPRTKTGRDIAQAIQNRRLTTADLLPAGRLLIDSAVAVQYLDGTEEQGALQITYGNFRALLPNGLSPNTKLSSPNVLLLTPSDLAETSPLDWQALSPQLTVLASTDPFLDIPASWVALPTWSWLSIETDGTRMWVEIGD